MCFSFLEEEEEVCCFDRWTSSCCFYVLFYKQNKGQRGSKDTKGLGHSLPSLKTCPFSLGLKCFFGGSLDPNSQAMPVSYLHMVITTFVIQRRYSYY